MNQLLKRVAGTFSLRVISMLLAFTTSIVLARTLGTNGLGTYTYIVSWVFILVIPSTLGFDGLLGREVAIYETKSEWGELKGILHSARVISLCASITLAVIASSIIWYIYRDNNIPLVLAFVAAMMSLPLISLRKIYRGTMKGLHQIVLGLLPEMLIAPLVLLTLIGCGSLVFQEKTTAIWALIAYSIAAGVAFIVSYIFHHRALPTQLKHSIQRYHIFDWIKSALPFMLIESVNVLNSRIDILMLGAMKGVDAAGIYMPVNRGAELIMFTIVAFIGPLAPTVATLYANNKSLDLQRILTKTTRIILLVSFLTSLLLIIFGNQYLLIFGMEFTSGILALKIRCVGRFISSTFGLSAMVLSMTGNANLTAASGFLAVIINIILNSILIPQYGVNGAAISTSFSLLLTGLINAIWVYKKTGINSTLFCGYQS